MSISEGSVSEDSVQEEISVALSSSNARALGDTDDSEPALEEGKRPPEDVQTCTWSDVTAKFPSKRVAGQKFLDRLKAFSPDTKVFFRKNSMAMGYHVWSTLTKLVRSYGGDKAEFQGIVQEVAMRHIGTHMTELHILDFSEALIGHCAEAAGDDEFEPLAEMVRAIVAEVGAASQKAYQECRINIDLVVSSWQMLRQQESTDVLDDVGLPEEEHEQEGDAADQKKKGMEGDAADQKKGGDNLGIGAAMFGSGGVDDKRNVVNVAVPKTFRAMLQFNAVVMQIGHRKWLPVMMEAMDGLAMSVSRPARFQEECEVLALQLARFSSFEIEEFRSVMLASLRSLLASSMDAPKEQAWSWFWQLVKKKLATMPQAKMKEEGKQWKAFYRHLGEQLDALKIAVFESLFHTCEEAQEYLKVSNSKLSFIMGRILTMMSTLYDDSLAAVKDLSALGLTHAGWGVKPDLLPLLVDAVMGVFGKEMKDRTLRVGAWWNLDLIARILDRTLLEGSTDVMQAISQNSGKLLRKAVGHVGRGKRAQGLLNIRVGTESISPLLWAVETNALTCATAILADVLTIRADRVAYYFGMGALFERHPDIVEVLCAKAPALLTQLFDGLIWRSSKSENGLRRVNYYVHHVLVDGEDKMKPSFAALVKHGDPELILHPFANFLLNILWARCVFLFFLTKVWFLITLMDFIVGLQYGILMFDSAGQGRWALISCRLFMYVLSLGHLLYKHFRLLLISIRYRTWVRVLGKIPMPRFVIESRQNSLEILLAMCLLLMLICEPFLHCLRVNPNWVTNCCYADEFFCKLSNSYDRISSIPQVLYFGLLADIVNINLYLSTFFVVMIRLSKDFLIFIAALVFITTAFASGIACLPQNGEFQSAHFYNFPSVFINLIRMALNSYGSEEEIAAGPQDLATFVMLYRITVQIVLLNTMIAQLANSYAVARGGAFGHACLLRGSDIVHIALPMMSLRKWKVWVASLKTNEPTELDKGEIGPVGGMQVVESAYHTQHMVLDRVKRFGGLTAPSLPWPQEHYIDDKESEVNELRAIIEDRFRGLMKKDHGKVASGSKVGSGTGSKLDSSQLSSGGSHLSGQGW